MRAGDLHSAVGLLRPADERFKPKPPDQGFVLRLLLSIPQARGEGEAKLVEAASMFG